MPRATLLVACLAALLALAPESARSVLEYDRQAIAGGALAVLWTGHLVHFSPAHAALDIGAFLAAGALAEREAGTRQMAIALACGAPALAVGLHALAPDLAIYRGLSGLAWLAACLAASLHARNVPVLRPALAVAALAAAGKLALDAAHGGATSAILPPDVRAEWRAHLLGALAGAAFACLAARARPATVAAGPQSGASWRRVPGNAAGAPIRPEPTPPPPHPP